MQPTGGVNGSITRFKEQLRRLCATTVSSEWENEKVEIERGFRLISEHKVYKGSEEKDSREVMPKSSILLSNEFFNRILESAVPLDLRAVAALRQSCLALDIYCWLTYRMHSLKEPICISWMLLHEQFGVGYPHTIRGRLDFKRKFQQQLKRVLFVYDVIVRASKQGVHLTPSRTSVEAENCG